MSSRNNPFEEIERLFDRMSRQFDDTSRMWGAGDPRDRLPSGGESLPVDLVEHDEEFVATVDLPGFEQDDVDVRVTDTTLRIDAEREETMDEEEENYVRRERRHRSANRSVQLPEEVDTEGVTARMNNGVLTISLPKLEARETRTIEIE